MSLSATPPSTRFSSALDVGVPTSTASASGRNREVALARRRRVAQRPNQAERVATGTETRPQVYKTSSAYPVLSPDRRSWPRGVDWHRGSVGAVWAPSNRRVRQDHPHSAVGSRRWLPGCAPRRLRATSVFAPSRRDAQSPVDALEEGGARHPVEFSRGRGQRPKGVAEPSGHHVGQQRHGKHTSDCVLPTVRRRSLERLCGWVPAPLSLGLRTAGLPRWEAQRDGPVRRGSNLQVTRP